jgi:hypothetical protein
MSRFHYWQYLLNTEGQPIPDANISLYLAGTDTPATVYFDEFASNNSDQTPQLITNNLGYFEFWVGDEDEIKGYNRGQKFKLEWEKPGVAVGSIDWIDIYPYIIEVDETDSFSNSKNKVISNKMAYRWEEHRTHSLIENGFPIHGIEPINEISEDNYPNKTLSNKLAKRWNDHAIYSFSSIASSASASPHGLESVNINDTDETFNKLVSNKVINTLDNDIVTIQDNIIEIYEKIEEMGNAGNIFLEHALDTEWILNHNFGVKYVSVTAYGLNDKEVKPSDIELINFNTVKLFFDEPVEGYAVITGNVIENTPNTSFEIVGDHGSLTGLNSDDHKIYALLDGTRGFTEPIDGQYPIQSDHLTTKKYVDYEINNIVLKHSKISESSYGDDHNQYIHIDGRRGFTNPIKGISPEEDLHLATKFYVDYNIENLQLYHHHLLIDPTYDDHLQYLHIDGRRGFTHNVSGIYPIEDEHLATKKYVKDYCDINIQNYLGNAGNIYMSHSLSDTWTFTHNFGTKYVAVTAYGPDDKEVKPTNIELIDYNNVKLIFDEPIEGYAVITGSIIYGEYETQSFEIVGDHGSLTGLNSDDHKIYALLDGTREFTNPISGQDPVQSDHLATKNYVDQYIITNINSIKHSDILDSDIGDNHTQYIHIDARRGFINPISGHLPILPNHLSTKKYVDDSIQNTKDYVDTHIQNYLGNSGNIYLSHSLSDTWILAHNFGTKYVAVTAYGPDDKEVKPTNIELIDYNNVKLIFENSIEGYAVITGSLIYGEYEAPEQPFEIVGDHGSLTGLNSDDHTIYALIDGTRGFTGPISGQDPVQSDHLTTKNYVDSITYSMSHSDLLESYLGDDHPQYIHISNARDITAKHTFNTNGIPFYIGSNSANYKVNGLNSDLVDGLHASSFLRSDDNDAVDGNTKWLDNKNIELGTNSDLKIYHDGTNNFISSEKDGSILYIKSKDSLGAIKNSIIIDPDNGVTIENLTLPDTGGTSEFYSEVIINNTMTVSGDIVTTEGDIVTNNNVLCEDIQITNPSTIYNTLEHNLFSGYNSEEHFVKQEINQLYQPDGVTPLVYTNDLGEFHVDGPIHIDGPIYRTGDLYNVDVQQITTMQSSIITRKDAVTSIPAGEIAGITVEKYDGTNDLIFGTDSNGYFKVGEEDSLQILATREDNPINSGISFWNDTEKRMDTSSNLIFNGSNLIISGNTAATQDWVENWVASNSNDYILEQHDNSFHSINYAEEARQIIAGTGLNGTGNLSSDITLSVKYGTVAGTACQGNDSRLSNDRTPLIHNNSLHSDINQSLLTTDNVNFNQITTNNSITNELTTENIICDYLLSGNNPNLYSTWNEGFKFTFNDDPFGGSNIVSFIRGSIRGFQIAGSSYGDTKLLVRGVHTGFSNGLDTWKEIYHSGNTHTHTNVDIINPVNDAIDSINCSRSILAGTGLDGGGELNDNRTLSVIFGDAAGEVCQGNDTRLADDRTRKTTISSSAPSGGSNGDVWLQYL